MFSAIKTLHQGVDVCINNAGLARPEPLLSGKTEGWRTMIDVSIPPREQELGHISVSSGHHLLISELRICSPACSDKARVCCLGSGRKSCPAEPSPWRMETQQHFSFSSLAF